MRVIVTRPRDDGSYDTTGMLNRLPITDLKTIRGIRNRVTRTKWAKPGTTIRIEIFNGESFYGPPSRTINVYVYPENCK